MDTQKVKEKKVEYVFTLRTVLREMGAVNRSPENQEAMTQIEKKLNECLVGEFQPELMVSGQHV